MGNLRVQLRAQAADDVERAIDHYLNEAGEPVAQRLIDALEAAIVQISRSPLVGTLRFSYELEVPDLRALPLRRFPYIVFYMASSDLVDVWRVLHTRRDIAAAMIEDAEDR